MGNAIANGDVCRDHLWRYASNRKHSIASEGGSAGQEDKTIVGKVNNSQETGSKDSAAAPPFDRSAVKASDAQV